MFFELCRLCLKNPGANKVSSNGNLLLDIFNCTGIKISAQDNLPQNVCNYCMDIVRKCKELRELAAQNDSDLRMLFGEPSEGQVKLTSPETEDKQEKITSAPTIKIQEKPIQISVRTDLFEKPTESNKEEPKYEKKRKKPKSSHNEEEGNNNNHIRKKTKLNISDDSESSVTNKDTNFDSAIVKDNTEKVKWKVSGLKTETGNDLICNICSKKFDTNKKLYLHKRQHDKKIICPIDVCGKLFTNKSELDRHVRTHTGEKPFTCNICDKRFAQNVTLKQHKESVHAVFS